MKTNLGTGYIIEGFDDGITMHNFIVKNQIQSIYYGKTSEIPEEIAEEVCHQGILTDLYRNYEDGNKFNIFLTVKESIQSACNQTYCIIYKEK